MCYRSLLVHLYSKAVASYTAYSRLVPIALCTFKCLYIFIRNFVYTHCVPTYCRLYMLPFAVGTCIFEGSGIVYSIRLVPTVPCTFECLYTFIRNFVYTHYAPTYCRLYMLPFAVGTFIFECILCRIFNTVGSFRLHPVPSNVPIPQPEFRLHSLYSNILQIVCVAVR
jgi:hypothetical protein